MSRICMTAVTFLFSFQLVRKGFSKKLYACAGRQIFIDHFLGDITIKSFKGNTIGSQPEG